MHGEATGTGTITATIMATPTRHAHAPANLDRAFAIGIAINLAFVAVEAFYGWRADSLALLADAGHNLGDVLGLVLAWAGAFAGRIAPDERHTYGWKRASILAAFANSLLLLVAIGSLAWAAIGRLAAPAPIAAGTVMAVAAAGIVVNGATALLFLRGRHDDLNVRGAFLHMAADAAVSAGVVVAAALTLWLGWTWLDPVASLGDRARHPVRHLGLVSRLAAPHVRRCADLDRPRSRPRRARGAARRRLRERPARLGDRNDRGRAHGAPGDARRPSRRRVLSRRRGTPARALRDRPRHAAGGDRGADDAVRRRRRAGRGAGARGA